MTFLTAVIQNQQNSIHGVSEIREYIYDEVKDYIVLVLSSHDVFKRLIHSYLERATFRVISYIQTQHNARLDQ